MPEPKCTIREHAGLEKVMHKLGMNQAILPDPELGQDVAFLAFIIKKQGETLAEAGRLLGAFTQDKDVCMAISSRCVGGHGEEPCKCLYCEARGLLARMD